MLVINCIFAYDYTYAAINFTEPDPLYDQLNLHLEATEYACGAMEYAVKWSSDVILSVKNGDPKGIMKDRLIQDARSILVSKIGESTLGPVFAEASNEFTDMVLAITSKDPIDRFSFLSETMAKAGCSIAKLAFLSEYEKSRNTFDISAVLNNKAQYYGDMLQWILIKEGVEEDRYHCGLVDENEIQNRMDQLYSARCSGLLNQRKMDFQFLENFDAYNQKFWIWIAKSSLNLNSSQIWNSSQASEKVNSDLFCGGRFDLQKNDSSQAGNQCTKDVLKYIWDKWTSNDTKIINYVMKNYIPLIDKMDQNKKKVFIKKLETINSKFLPIKVAYHYAKSSIQPNDSQFVEHRKIQISQPKYKTVSEAERIKAFRNYKWSDIKTFQVIDGYYGKDKNWVYSYGIGKINGADPETFISLTPLITNEDNLYFRYKFAIDKNQVFYMPDSSDTARVKILEWVNPETFNPETYLQQNYINYFWHFSY